MFTLSEANLKKVKLLLLAAEITLTFLLCTSMLYIYHEYSETDLELENSEKLRIGSLRKILGSDGKYVIRYFFTFIKTNDNNILRVFILC